MKSLFKSFIFLRFSVFFLPFAVLVSFSCLPRMNQNSDIQQAFINKLNLFVRNSGINRCEAWTLSFQVLCQYLHTAAIIVVDSQSPANYAVQKWDLRFLTVTEVNWEHAVLYLTALMEQHVFHLKIIFNNYIIMRWTLETMRKQLNCQRSNWILHAVHVVFISRCLLV